MHFHEIVEHCPRCGSAGFLQKSPNGFVCDTCGFHFHINVATAVFGLIVDNTGRVLFIRRGRDPGKGKWSVPGGFVDANETAEAAVAREIHEEVGLHITEAKYLCSFPNPYEYKGVVFPVLDVAFICQVRSTDDIQIAADEVETHAFLSPNEIRSEDIAFPSVRYALEQYTKSANPAS